MNTVLTHSSNKQYPGRFNFVGRGRFFLVLSIVMTLAGLTLIFSKGFVLGIDFAGGLEMQVQFQKNTPPVHEVREFLKKQGAKDAVVQSFGEANEILIRMKQNTAAFSSSIANKIKTHFNGAEIRRIDSVGPQIGNELKRKGILAVCYSLLLILIYLGLRFDYKYAPSAVFCLFHDSILTMAVFSLLGKEVNVQTLASVLAIIGYSLNDTIVTFDRIRENTALFFKKESFESICNRSLNDVLSRTLLTSITTLLAVSAMWFLTSGVIKDFAFTLGIGVLIGTYSSIYTAAPLVVFLNQLQENKKTA